MSTLDRRRPLTGRERWMALGAGVGAALAAGLAAAYLSGVLLQRERLRAGGARERRAGREPSPTLADPGRAS